MKFGSAVLEIFDNSGWTDGAWLYYKLTNEPKGSGELIKQLQVVEGTISRKIT